MSVAALIVSMEQRRGLSSGLNRPRVPRRLFGSPDHAELDRKYEQLSRDKMKQFKEKWGYDTELDRPVPDHPRYLWEPVGAPAAPEKASVPVCRERSDSSGSESSLEEQSSLASAPASKTLKQATLDEFFQGRKRSAGAVEGTSKKLCTESSSSTSGSSSSPSEEEVCSSQQHVQ